MCFRCEYSWLGNISGSILYIPVTKREIQGIFRGFKDVEKTIPKVAILNKFQYLLAPNLSVLVELVLAYQSCSKVLNNWNLVT